MGRDLSERGGVVGYRGPNLLLFQPFAGPLSNAFVAIELAEFVVSCGYRVVLQGPDFLVLQKEGLTSDGNRHSGYPGAN